MPRTIAALSLLVVSPLIAQGEPPNPDTRSDELVVAACRRTLAGVDANEAQQLDAIRQLIALDVVAEQAQRLQLPGVLALGLGCQADAVVEAAAVALTHCADRDGAIRELLQRTIALRGKLAAMPAPDWPEHPMFTRLRPQLLAPPLDPAFARSRNERKRLEREQADFERKAKKAHAAYERAVAAYEKAHRKALDQQARRRDVAGQLTRLIAASGTMQEDVLLDEWLEALRTLERCVPECRGAIVPTICATRRRDAVQLCLPFVADLGTALGATPGAPGLTPGEHAAATDADDILLPTTMVRAILAQIGDQPGAPVPVPDPEASGETNRFLRVVKAFDGDAWHAWAEKVLPQLPEKLAEAKR